MKTIKSYRELPNEAKACVVALGNFDGVHKGHRKIIEETIKIAKDKKTKSAVMTFEPHPAAILRPDNKNFRLTDLKMKEKLISEIGADFLFTIPFTEDFSKITAEDFIKTILIDSLQVKHVVIGHDFIFGHNRTGNPDFMQKKSAELSFGITIISAIKDENEICSSTSVREALRQGDLKRVNKILGRNYSIDGLVIKGDARGRQIGFPTANINLGDLIRPAFGVYAVKIRLEDKIYNAVANIGIRPTFGKESELLEVHIFNFDKNIYDSSVNIEFIDYIRTETKFKNVDELTKQILIDCKKAEEILR